MRATLIRTSSILLLLSLLSLPLAASGQIVNVQAKFNSAPEEGFHGVLSGTIDWRTGNTEYLALRGSLTGSYTKGRHLLLGMASGEYGLISGQDEPFLARAFEHLRYRLGFGDRFSAETFAQHEFDRYRKLKLRFLAGLGGRFDALSGEHGGLAIGLAMMLDHEELSANAVGFEGGSTVGRLSLYLIGRVEVMEGISFSETVYAQPRIDAFGDIRLLSESALTLKANSWVSVALSVVVAYDSEPPAGFDPEVEALDTQLKTTLAVKF